jgi:hypothetical protein
VSSKLQLIYSSIFCLLSTHICFYHLFISTYCGSKVSSCLKLLTNKVSLLTCVGSSYIDYTLALDVSYHLCNAMLGWNTDYHMYMIFLYISCFYLAFLMPRQLCQHSSQFFTDLSKQCLSSILGNYHHMIFAFPACMS